MPEQFWATILPLEPPPVTKINGEHFNECVHYGTDLFDSKCQSDMLTLIAMKFDE